MQKILLVALLSVTSTSALALDLNPYIEGQVGHIDAKTIDTQTYSGTFNGSSLSSKLRLKYDSDISWSGEVGLKDVGIPNLRIGAAYTHAAIDLNQLSLLANGSTAIKDSAGTTVANLSNGKLDLNKDSIAGTGTITYTDSSGTPGVTLPIGIIIPDSSLSSRFVDVKNKIFNDLKKNIDLFMLNAYYDFKNSTPFTPYIGAGIGLANIKDTKAVQFAYSAIIGAKYNINQNFYFGAKATYTVVNAPTSDIYGVDIKLEDINFLRADVVIGYEF